MADNVAITAGSGTTIATDDVAGVHYQIVKVNMGALDAVGSIFTGTVTLGAGSASIGILGANSGTDIGDVTINNASGASAVNIQDGGNSITIDAPLATPVYVRQSDGVDASQISYQGRMYVELAGDGVTVSGNVLLATQRQPINTNTNGAILVSGQANRKIRVLNGLVVAAGAVTMQLKSNNNSDLTGPLALAANGGFQVPQAGIGNFETLTGEALTVNLSSAISIGGWLTYVIV